MKTISILNLKGGVAKTFTAANMAYELYRRGYKVLLIDNDKQGNLSKAYSRYDAENVAPVTRLLAGDWENADELIQHTEYEGIDIVTANMSLFGATWNLTKEDSENQIERYKALVYAKMQYYGDCTIYGKYDYCIIDNPPDIFLLYIYPLLTKYPKYEKFSLQTATRNAILEMLQEVIKWDKTATKSHLYTVDTALQESKELLRLAHDLKYSAMNARHYGESCRKLKEIGVMLGELIEEVKTRK